MRVVFMGSPEFALPALAALTQHTDVVGVVTQPDRPSGRGRKLRSPPVKQAASEHGIPLIQPPRLSHPDAFQQLHAWAPDVIVVAAYGQILKPEVLSLPPLGCLNVHASLLPRWRGASPVQAAILHGDRITGVTIMKMDEGLDTGPILAQQETPIAPNETGGQLSERLARMGAELLTQTLPAYAAGDLSPQPQDHAAATYAPLLRKRDGWLDPSKPADLLARQVRAFEPWPGSYFGLLGRRIRVLRASARPGAGSPGSLTIVDDAPALVTAQGLLVLELVQPAGRKPMPGDAFLRGLHHLPSSCIDPEP